MFGSSGGSSAPPPPPIPDPPPNPPQFGSQAQKAAGKRGAQPGMGFGSTIMTAGLTEPSNTARKTLLGQ